MKEKWGKVASREDRGKQVSEKEKERRHEEGKTLSFL